MAAAAACKCVARLGMDSGIIGLTKFSGAGASKSFSSSARIRQFSRLVKVSGVDALALVGRLEGQGVPSNQAEAITELLTDSLGNVSEPLVVKEMRRIEMLQEMKLAEVKAEVQSSEGHHFSLVQHEIENLRNLVDKKNSELRNQIQRQSSELGKRSSELMNDIEKQSNKLKNRIDKQRNDLRNDLDKVTHAFRAQLEESKYRLKKYFVGAVVSGSAVGLAGLAVFRMLM